MLEKGMVMELREAYAIVLKPGGEFIRVQRKDGLKVGDQIYFLPEDYYTAAPEAAVIPFPARKRAEAPKCRENRWRQLAGLAAAVVLIVTLSLYPGVQTVCAVASFDGDQDLQLELDQRSRIMGGYSGGEPLSPEDLQKLKGKKLSDVGEELSAFMGSGPVLIGYASYQGDADEDARMEQLLREMFSSHVVLYLTGNSEDIDLAESAGTSLGFHLAGEVVDEDTREVLDEFLEACAEYREELEEDADDGDGELAYLNEIEFEELLEEIRRNPDCEGEEDVLEILADRLEELHEEHKKQTWGQEDDDSDNDDEEEDEDEDPDSEASEEDEDD